MMRSNLPWVAVLSMLVLAACSHPDAPGVARAPLATLAPQAAAAASAPSPPDAGIGALHPWLTTQGDDFAPLPCDLHGLTLLCGVPAVLVVRGGGVDHDAALEAGLPRGADGRVDGRVEEAFGDFPRDAWLVLKQPSTGHDPPMTLRFFLWSGSAWVQRGEKMTLAAYHHIRPWGPGGAVLWRTHGPDVFDPGPAIEGLGEELGRSRALQPGYYPCHATEDEWVVFARGFSDGSLRASVRDDCYYGGIDDLLPVFVIWPPGSTVARTEELPVWPGSEHQGEIVHVDGIAGDRPDDVTVYGMAGRGAGPMHAYLAHFDGRTWALERTPPLARGDAILGGSMAGYARDRSGAEWLLMNESAWRRRDGGAWARVDAGDAPLYAVQATDDGAVWFDGLAGSGRVLLSTAAPSRAVDPDEVCRGFACAPSAPPPPPQVAHDRAVTAAAPDAAVGSTALPPSIALAGGAALHPWVTTREPGLSPRPCDLRGLTLLCDVPAVLVVRDGRIEHDASLEAGLPREFEGDVDGRVEYAFGDFPRDAWLVLRQPPRRPGPPFALRFYRWWSGAWQERSATRTAAAVAFGPWASGGAVQWREHDPDGRVVPGPEIEGLGEKLGRSHTLDMGYSCDGVKDEWVVFARGFSDGSLMASARSDCRIPIGVLVGGELLYWPPASSARRFERLPTLPGSEHAGEIVLVQGIAGDSPDDVTVYGVQGPHGGGNGPMHAYLAHFDGRAWALDDAPAAQDLRDDSVVRYGRGAHGDQWMSIDRAPWRRRDGGAWAPVAVPGYASAELETVTDDGGAWLLGERQDGEGTVLLSTEPASRAEDLEDLCGP